MKRLKDLYLAQAIEQKLQIEKFYLNSKKNSYSQGQDIYIISSHY